jgi:N-acyl homoserine lactone hydrolase
MRRATVTRLLVGGFLAPESVAPAERVVVNHQSVLVHTDAGRLLMAGQIFRDASGFARAVTAHRLAGEGYEDPPSYPEWLPHLLDLEPYRVVFGHDHAIWQPDA